MLRIEADGLTMNEIAELRARHGIEPEQGFVKVLHARKVDQQIVWSTQRMKEGYWKTLQTEKKTAETTPVAA